MYKSISKCTKHVLYFSLWYNTFMNPILRNSFIAFKSNHLQYLFTKRRFLQFCFKNKSEHLYCCWNGFRVWCCVWHCVSRLCNWHIHSNAVILYAIAISYCEQCCVLIVSKTFPATIISQGNCTVCTTIVYQSRRSCW